MYICPRSKFQVTNVQTTYKANKVNFKKMYIVHLIPDFSLKPNHKVCTKMNTKVTFSTNPHNKLLDLYSLSRKMKIGI